MKEPEDSGGVGVRPLVRGLVQRKPHHVVGIHQRHGQEPGAGGGIGAMGPQPIHRLGGDHRVEVPPGPRPPYVVAVVASPAAVAEGIHVGPRLVGEMELPQVGRFVSGIPKQPPHGGYGRVERGVGREADVVHHLVLGQVAAGVQAGPGRRARRGVGVVAGEVQAVAPQPVVGGHVHHTVQP